MGLTSEELSGLRHPTERSRFIWALLVLVPLAVLLLIAFVASAGAVLVLIAAVLFSIWVGVRIIFAQYFGNLVLASDTAFPEVTSALADAKQRFGYSGHVDAFVYDEGTFNLLLVPLLRRKVLLVNSELLKPCTTDVELRFVVGRFIGSLSSKHYRFAWLQVFLASVEKLFVFNILLFPYERAVVYSGDQMGLDFIDGDVDAATRALLKTVVGSDIAERADIASFVAQGIASRGSLFSWLARAYSSFPHTTHRVENLLQFAALRYTDESRRAPTEAAGPALGVAAQ